MPARSNIEGKVVLITGASSGIGEATARLLAAEGAHVVLGLADSISDETGRNEMKSFRRIAIPADAVARSIAYAIDQPAEVDVSEIVVRPTASPF